MPLYSIIIFVVEHCQASLIVKLLQSLYSQSTLVLHILQLSSFEACKVVWLPLSRISFCTPESSSTGDVCWRNLFVTVGPKPAVDVYRLECSSITAFVQEVALPTRSVEGCNIIYKSPLDRDCKDTPTYLCA